MFRSSPRPDDIADFPREVFRAFPETGRRRRLSRPKYSVPTQYWDQHNPKLTVRAPPSNLSTRNGSAKKLEAMGSHCPPQGCTPRSAGGQTNDSTAKPGPDQTRTRRAKKQGHAGARRQATRRQTGSRQSPSAKFRVRPKPERAAQGSEGIGGTAPAVRRSPGLDPTPNQAPGLDQNHNAQRTKNSKSGGKAKGHLTDTTESVIRVSRQTQVTPNT